MSKMAAYNAGTYRITGHQTRVPIAAFLEDNGFVPSRHAGGAQQRGVTPGPSPASQGSPAAGVVDDEGRSEGVKASVSPEGIKASMSPEGVKASSTPGPSANMSPEPILPSIEGDILMGDGEESLAGLYAEESRVQDLQVRVSQLEGVVYTLQNRALGDIVDRVNELEKVVEDLKSKVGSGCHGEVAKMRDVMGGLKTALDKVGGFV